MSGWGRGRSRVRAAVVALACAALVVLSGCSADGSISQPAIAQPTPSTPADFVLVQYPGAGFGGLYAQTAAATRSIDMEMYELEDDREIAALVAAHARGADVRVLLDSAYEEKQYNGPAFDALRTGGVEVCWAPSSTIFHIKTTVFDGTTADISSANLTPRYYSTTRDAAILDSFPPQVSAIEHTFEHDWKGQPPARDEVTTAGLLWSPDAEAAMVGRIRSAKKSIDFTSEEFSDTDVYRALASAARAGIRCRIVMMDAPGWARGFAAVTAAGCRVHVLPDTPAGLYIHEKELLLDAGTPNASITLGSQNASWSSLSFNRELSVVLSARQAPAVLAAVTRTFRQDYAKGTEWQN